MPHKHREKRLLLRSLRTICHNHTRGPHPTGNLLDRLQLGWTTSVAYAAPAMLVCRLCIPNESELRRPITAERYSAELAGVNWDG